MNTSLKYLDIIKIGDYLIQKKITTPENIRNDHKILKNFPRKHIIKMNSEKINTLHEILDDVVSNHLVKHQLDSFKNYINWELNAVIRNEPSIRLTYPSGYLLLIKLSGVHLTNPTTSYIDDNGRVTTCNVLPCEARYRMLNYNGTVLINVNIQRNSLKTKHKSVLLNVPIASHPVMVGSDACSLKKLSRVLLTSDNLF